MKIVCAVLALWATNAYSQPDTLWTNRFSGAISSGAGNGGAAICTIDGGFAAAGLAQLQGRRDTDLGMVKTDSLGQPVWSRRFECLPDSVHRSDEVEDLIQMPDSGYILVGSASPHGVVARTDANGDLLWIRYFRDNSYFEKCALTSDGNFLVSTFRNLRKLSDENEGEIIWEQEYENVRVLSAIVNCDNGGFLICGSTSGASDMYAAKIDSDGEIQWEAAYGTENADFCLAAVQTLDGGWCLVGDSVSGGIGQHQHFAMIIRIDADGNLLWQRLYQGGEDWHYLLSVCETPDGGITAAGTGGQGYYLLRTDYFGEELWHGYYGGDICYSLLSMDDGGYTMAGYNGRSPGCLLVRTEPDPVVIPFELSSSPSHDFGEVFVDSVANYELVVTNTGRRYADIIRAEVSSSSEVFAVEFGELPRLFPGDSTMLPLAFSPDSAIAYEGVLSVFFGADIVTDTLEIALTGRGIPNVGVRDSAVNPPQLTMLLEVSPNPFNSTVTISYASGPATQPTRLAIYDVNGRKVADLTPTFRDGKLIHRYGTRNASIIWDASNQPAGIYLCSAVFRGSSGGEELSQIKLILLR